MSSDLISRQAAIDMCRLPRMRNADCSDFEMEIMMLPPAHPEPCEDVVSRAAVQYLLAHFVDEDKYVDACDGLKHLPPVTPKQRTGGWIKGWYTNGNGYHRCNQCFAEIEDIFFGNDYEVNFCPNCGAKMIGDAE